MLNLTLQISYHSKTKGKKKNKQNKTNGHVLASLNHNKNHQITSKLDSTGYFSLYATPVCCR